MDSPIGRHGKDSIPRNKLNTNITPKLEKEFTSGFSIDATGTIRVIKSGGVKMLLISLALNNAIQGEWVSLCELGADFGSFRLAQQNVNLTRLIGGMVRVYPDGLLQVYANSSTTAISMVMFYM